MSISGLTAGPILSSLAGQWANLTAFYPYDPNLQIAWRYHPNLEAAIGGYTLIGIRAIVPIEEPRKPEPARRY
jgi:hypothetical protein